MSNIKRPPRPWMERRRIMAKLPIEARLELIEIEREKAAFKREADRKYWGELQPKKIKPELRDRSATMGLFELAQVLKITTAEVRQRVRDGRLPAPLRGVRPYRFLAIELLTHEAWQAESVRSGRRRYQQMLDRREAVLRGKPLAEGAKATVLPIHAKGKANH
jgi:hypothetical protein